ncbi:MAG: hypothetical protein IPP12_09780 [Nitrospira sp.]|nr:hypothetical protein [Nitrospira sp.]MBK9947456.1 hypothetical protein [Nitrospira sp.]
MTHNKLTEQQTLRSIGRRFAIGAFGLPLLLAGSLTATSAMAHIVPVDFGALDLGVATTTIERNNGVSGDKGWIDGADGDWGDTHATGTYSFSLTGTGSADVTLALRGKSNAFGGAGLSPGFTLYQGLAHVGGDHDFSIGSELIRTADCAATPGCTTTEGSFRAMNSFSITTDADPTGTSPSVFTYVGHAYNGSVTLPGENSPLYDGQPYLVPNGDGTATGNAVSFTFHDLTPGNYIVFAAGANYAAVTSPARGMGLTLTVTPVPVPAAAWLFGSGLLGLWRMHRRKTA